MSLPPNYIVEPLPAVEFSSRQLETLDQISDWFLPAVEGYPSVKESDPNGEVLALALEQLRPLIDSITSILDAVGDSNIDQFMDNLEDESPEQFESIRTLIVGRYLSCQPVWDALGYAGRVRIPIRIGEADEYLSDGLLDQTKKRGKIYRPTPAA